MPAYKDKQRKTWYANFYFTDWKGERKHKCKRGFLTQRDAREWEKEFLDNLKRGADIPFPSLITNYMEDLGRRLKPTTMENKENIINKKLLPFFKNYKVNEITAIVIRKWQGELLDYRDSNGNPYSQTYLKTINNQLSAILNYAVTYYDLSFNPCLRAGSIGKSHADAMQIWTLDQYEQFTGYEKKSAGHLAFNILFWSGCREGELLALTGNDFIQSGSSYYLQINKNYEIVKGVEYILTPKTPGSNRMVSIPNFLYYEIQCYKQALYDYHDDDRLFYFTKHYLVSEIKRVARLAELPPIRVHDLRHSHASLLIEMGFDILMVSQRLGHDRVETTWRTYAHLYPNKDKILATRLDQVKLQGLTKEKSVEDQLIGLLSQFKDQQEPRIIDISNENIIKWDPDKREKCYVSKEEFEAEFELSEDVEGIVADAEIFAAGYIVLCGMVYCLESRGLPAKYL